MNLPRRVRNRGSDLIDDGRLVIDDQNVERVVIAFDFLDTATLGLEFDDASCSLDEHVLFERLYEVVTNSHFGNFHDVIPA